MSVQNRLFVIIITILLAAPHAYPAQSVTQWGITWNFADDETCGTYLNGDNWCVGPVTINSISPGWIVTDRGRNGSQINPSAVNGQQGYDTCMAYDSSRNVGDEIAGGTPLVLLAGNSIVSTISNTLCGDQGAGVHVSYVKTAAVLTILSEQPPENSFRPGISGTNKSAITNTIDYNSLPSIIYPGTKPDIESYKDYLRMVWLDHNPGYTTRYMHPSDSGLNNYYFPQTFAEIALMLAMEYPAADKKTLIDRYVQLGIDLYSYTTAGPGWPPDGGHSQGRKLPILIAGKLLGNQDMMNIGQKSGDYLYANGHGPGDPPSDYIHFGEDGQVFYVTKADVEITNGASWDPDTRNPNAEAKYTTSMIGMPEWGIKRSINPEQSDASWTALYRTISSGGPVFPAVSAAAQLHGLRVTWNNTSFFAYAKRYLNLSSGFSDDCVVPDEQSGGAPSTLSERMWRIANLPALVNGTGSSALNGAGNLIIQ